MKMFAQKPTVLLADDHQGVLARVSRLLENEFELVAQVTNGLDALNYATLLKPDAAILDFSMPGMDGVSAARELRRRGIRSAIVFLSIQLDPDYIQVAEEIGAGYVPKTRMQSDLLATIRRELFKKTVAEVSPGASDDSGPPLTAKQVLG
jgi:DNA-binding NarL/FixJ family response regulator